MPLSSVLGAQSLVRPGVCTSSTRPASPFEGQTIYETDTDRLATWDGSAWIPYVRQTAGKVLQVVSTAKTDTFTTTSTTYTDVTGLTATITPSSTSSKIFITGMVNGGAITSTNNMHVRIARGGTGIFVGDAAGSRTQATNGSLDNSLVAAPFPIMFLDSPSTTSSTTYAIQVRSNVTSQTVYVNRAASDTDSSAVPRLASSITVMEISG